MRIRDDRPLRATALIVLSACGFGSLSTLTVLVLRGGLPLLPAIMWRFFLAALLLLALVAMSSERSIPPRRALRLMAIGAIAQATITYFSLRALDYIPVGPLAFLFFTYPAWVAVIGVMTGRERLSIPKIAALALAMSGIALMVGLPSSGSLHPIGVGLALSTAILFAIYLPTLHSAQRGLPPLVSTFYLVTGVFISLLFVSLATGTAQLPGTLSLWGLLLAMSIAGTVVSFMSLIAGLRVLGALRTSIISTIEPFFTALLGLIVLGEASTFALLAGGVLIAVAVIVLHFTASAVFSETQVSGDVSRSA